MTTSIVERQMEAMTFQVLRMVPEARLPTRGSEKAAGYDLYAAEDMTIKANGRGLVSTGIAMTIPDGYYGRIAPRSGLAVKHGLDVGAGVIDSDYSSCVKVLLFNHGEDDFKIDVGHRIAQLIIVKIVNPSIEEVQELVQTVRGSGGFGSTGR
jgi:dUTP pyrophosphatase